MTAPRCIALLGPGLDGRLAIELVRRQGVQVIAATLGTPFTSYHVAVVAGAAALDVPLITLVAGDEYLERVRHPRFGYTREMAPCLDCKVAMLRAARDKLAEHEATFLVTGDVVGQRMPGQSKRDLALVDFHAGVEGRVLRPLSARLLAPLAASASVDVHALLGISGRGRQQQLALARQWGWQQVPAVTSGCLLADAAYARKLRDVLEHDAYEPRALPLLELGRYYRLSADTYAVLGRNAAENGALQSQYAARPDAGMLIEPANFVGPTALVVGRPREADLTTAADLVVQQGRKLAAEALYEVVCRTPACSQSLQRSFPAASALPPAV